MSYLSQREINGMKKDWSDLLQAPEAQTVFFVWRIGNTGTWDPTYKKYVGGAPIYDFTEDIKCIVSFLTESDIETLAVANVDLKIGDAVFYFARGMDFSGKEALTIVHKTIEWYPIVPQPAPFEISGVPLGADQMATILFCTRIRKTETTDSSGGGVVI